MIKRVSLRLFALVLVASCCRLAVADNLCGDVEESNGYMICVGTTCAESYESCALNDKDAQGNYINCACGQYGGA
jgi:hypothetical protein